VPKVLDLIAKETGMPEFRHAPWTTFGKSSRGEFPFRMGWIYPERTISSVSYHAETPTFPVPKWAARQDRNILHLSVNGQEEWSGTWYRHHRPSLLNYHATNAWLAHQVVLKGVGHGNYVDVCGSKGWGKPVPEGKMSCLRVWDYIALHVDKAMTLRLPKDVYPTKGPVKLKPVDRTKGYLIHPRAPEEVLGMKWMAWRHKEGAYQLIPWPQEKHPVHAAEQGKIDPSLWIRPYADVQEPERKKLFWVADREQAEAWLKLHTFRKLPEGLLPATEAAGEAAAKAEDCCGGCDES
jgi:hypothetical protein